MHKKLLFIGLTIFILWQPLRAEDVTMVQTSGVGRYEKNTNYFLFISGKKYQVTVPSIVKEGDQITIQYEKGAKIISDDFSVVRISMKDDLCRLHNRIVSQHDKYPGDIIYIRPCKKIK